MAGFVDRERARRILAEHGLDAVVVSEPDAFAWATGTGQGPAGEFRRAGAGFATIPAEPDLPIGMVMGDLAGLPGAATHPLWIETGLLSAGDGSVTERIERGWREAGRAPGFSRPETFNLSRSIEALRAILDKAGLLGRRLGFDLDFVPANDADMLRAALAGTEVVDGSPALVRLRAVKAPEEQRRLVLATGLTEAGLIHLFADARAGQDAGDLTALFRAGVAAEAARRGVVAPPSWAYISIGQDPWRPGGRVGPGAVIKADVGCVVEGYSTDLSRNAVASAATPDQAALHALIETAFEAGLAAIRPGLPLAGVHRAVTAAMRAGGLPGFSRGHVGHSLGRGQFPEQAPFLSAEVRGQIEPGMMLALEVPLYVDGLGGFNLEEPVLVTGTGARSLTRLPRTLTVL